ncbi:hypothetical protein T492DRAFT_862074 [Pavlovales sp. CCMP2436]|nr:hypothetical protein T492DRAFT_862074 [Pavlovales sp. CCMP2436]
MKRRIPHLLDIVAQSRGLLDRHRDLVEPKVNDWQGKRERKEAGQHLARPLAMRNNDCDSDQRCLHSLLFSSELLSFACAAMIDAEAKADARVLELLVNGDRRTLLAWPAGPISSDAPAGDRLAGCLVDSLTRGASGPDSRARALGLALLRAERELSRAKSAAASRAALEAPDVAELEDKLRSVMAQSAQTEAKLADAQRRLLEKDSSAERAKQWASGDANADARVHIRELGTELGHAQQLNAQQADTIRSQPEDVQA